MKELNKNNILEQYKIIHIFMLHYFAGQIIFLFMTGFFILIKLSTINFSSDFKLFGKDNSILER